MYKVSVIIPTYGEPILLKMAIESILSQTLTDIELIVVDDNDPNTEARYKTESLIDLFLFNNQRLKYIKHESNKNGAAARNTGITSATGKYIALLDSDDEYKLDRLEKCFNLMEEASKEIAGVYTGCEFKKGGKSINVVRNIKPGNFLIETLASSFMFCTGSNFFLRKSVVDELNGFDEGFVRHQDYEFLVRLFTKYSLAAIREVLVIKNNENFNAPNIAKLIDVKKKYLNKYKHLIVDLPKKDQYYIYHTQYVSLAELAMRNMNTEISKEYYSKATHYGRLTSRELIRKWAFSLLSLIRYNWS